MYDESNLCAYSKLIYKPNSDRSILSMRCKTFQTALAFSAAACAVTYLLLVPKVTSRAQNLPE